MVDEDLGTATIVYDAPEEGTVERTVQNEHVAYFQNHWIVKIDEDEGQDVVRRIPHTRVHYVERTVEQFEDEISSVRRQVGSVADDIRSKLFGDEGDRRRQRSEVERIEVEDGDED